MGEPLDQNLRGYRVSGVQGLKVFLFDCRSREVPSVEDSCKHVAHTLGGDRVVDRGHNNKRPEKGVSGDRWRTHVTWEGVNPLLTYRISRIRKGGARGLNTPTR
jgi:hypothetical protein